MAVPFAIIAAILKLLRSSKTPPLRLQLPRSPRVRKP